MSTETITPVRQELWVARRPVIFEKNDAFDHPEINDTLERFQHLGKIPTVIGLSQISIGSAYRIRSAFKHLSNEEMLAKYEEHLGELPDVKHCMSGDIAVFGPNNVAVKGMRHVVVKLAPKSEKRVRNESRLLLGKFGLEECEENAGTPHVGVFKTPDYSVAQAVAAELAPHFNDNSQAFKLGTATSKQLD